MNLTLIFENTECVMCTVRTTQSPFLVVDGGKYATQRNKLEAAIDWIDHKSNLVISVYELFF